MPSEQFLNQNLKPTKPAGKSMEELQKEHYDARAGTYDFINEKESRAKKLEEADKFFIEKLENLLAPGEITYLDFGCGTGTHTKKFLSNLKNNQVAEGYGIDISGEMVKQASEVLPNFQVIEGGVNKINFENKFDLMTSFFYVLGHLEKNEIELFFENVARSLKPGGILCFDVLKSSLSSKIEKIIKKKDKYFTYDTKLPDNSLLKGGDGKPIKGSIREFSPKEIVNLAKKNNLEIVDLTSQKYYKEYTVILRKKILS